MRPTIATIIFIIVFIIVFFTNVVAFIGFLIDYFDVLAMPGEIDDPILAQVVNVLYSIYQYIKQIVINPYGIIALVGIDLILLASIVKPQEV